jgi:hypothetical protein
VERGGDATCGLATGTRTGAVLVLVLRLESAAAFVGGGLRGGCFRGCGSLLYGGLGMVRCLRALPVRYWHMTAGGTGGTNVGTNEQQISCIQIINGEETDDLLDLTLPDDIADLNRASIELADLYLSIPGATIKGNSVVIPATPVFIVLDPPEQRRHLSSASIGPKTLAIVRVSTSDKSPIFSANALRNGIFGNGINMKTQYEACSFGQLRWEPAPVGAAGVLEVQVGQRMSEFTSGPTLVTAAQKQIKKEFGISSVAELGDKVMFCLPAGTGGWIASAGLNHWRAQFNDEWCLSLTGT